MAVADITVKDEDKKTRSIITFQYGDVSIFARLVEGRYPKWRDIVPKSCLMHDVTVRNGELKTALKNIAPSFSKSDPHVDLVFAGHRLTLNTSTGHSRIFPITLPLMKSMMVPSAFYHSLTIVSTSD